MSLVQKVESGYLQLLRVVFLLFATIAIAAVCVLGVQFLAGRNAEPVAITKKIELKADGFDAAGTAQTKTGSAQSKNKGEVKDSLLNDFISNIDSNAKRMFPDFSLNKEYVANVFYEIDRDPTLGREFLEQLVPVMAQSYKNPNFKPKNMQEFGDKTVAMLDHFKSDYRGQAGAIRAAKAEAEMDANHVRISAGNALVSAAGGFGVFVLLILLIVLLKIERNLRSDSSLLVKQE